MITCDEERIFNDLGNAIKHCYGEKDYKILNRNYISSINNILLNKNLFIDLLNINKFSNIEFRNSISRLNSNYASNEVNLRGRYKNCYSEYNLLNRFDNYTFEYDNENNVYRILFIIPKDASNNDIIDFITDSLNNISYSNTNEIDINNCIDGNFKANCLSNIKIEEFNIKYKYLIRHTITPTPIARTVRVILLTINFIKEIKNYNNDSKIFNLEKLIYDFYHDEPFNKEFRSHISMASNLNLNLKNIKDSIKNPSKNQIDMIKFILSTTNNYHLVNLSKKLISIFINSLSNKNDIYDYIFTSDKKLYTIFMDISLVKDFVYYILDTYTKASYDSKIRSILYSGFYNKNNRWNSFMTYLISPEPKNINKIDEKYINKIFKILSKKKFSYDCTFLSFINKYKLDYSKLSEEKMINDAGPSSYYSNILGKKIDSDLDYIMTQCIICKTFLPLILYIQSDNVTIDILKENGSFIAYYLFEYSAGASSISHDIPNRYIKHDEKYEIILEEFKKYTEKQNSTKIKSRVISLYSNGKTNTFGAELYRSLYNCSNKTINKIIMNHVI